MRNEHHATPFQMYSLAQMDNFYHAFAAGTIKATSVMNYLQHLFIAERCQPDDWVLDVCCGRGLQVPLLKHSVPSLGGYIGMDIAQEHLQETAEVIRYGDGCPPVFPHEFVHGDVTTNLIHLNRLFHVVIYTSALEHMKKEAGIASLQQIAQVLRPDGTFYLSTPKTSGSVPRKLQHHVHVYEWDQEELEVELTKSGFRVVGCYGLLPPTEKSLISMTLDERFGAGAAAWFEAMQQMVPAPLLEPLCAIAIPDVATELLYVLRHAL